MDETTSAVELGLQMLQDRRKQLGQPAGITTLDRQRIDRQLELSRQPWSEIRSQLSETPELVHTLDDLWLQIVPYLIKGNEVSPVHHIPYVVRFMVTIGLAELDSRPLKHGVLGALLHDVGLGDCLLPKVSEASIQLASGAERDRLRQLGIQSRLEHMKLGVEISRPLLEDCRRRKTIELADDEIQTILDVVATHDYGKIPLLDDVVDRQWLLKPGPEDWLKQCHWEADALWMLTPAGVQVDLERDRIPDTPANRRARQQFNLGLHREIIQMYAKECSPEELRQYGFRDGLLYRSRTGYELACQLMRDGV